MLKKRPVGAAVDSKRPLAIWEAVLGGVKLVGRLLPFDVDRAVSAKVLRLASGGQPRVVDLFSGCGGISLGFHRAGFSIAAAVEIDPLAALSHATNFHREAHTFDAHAKARDLTATDPATFCQELGLGLVDEAVDVLVGGPPCQAYARIGRAKLGDLAANPEAFKVDPRRNLYLAYLAWVTRLKPLALLMENVPDIMNQSGHNVAVEIVELLEGHGYSARYGLVNTAFYGVPQMRERVFIVAYRKELEITPALPEPTRHLELPSGYHGSRSVALKYVDLLSAGAYLSPRTDPSLPPPVTAEQAIGDLPPIETAGMKRGTRKASPKTFLRYRDGVPISDYSRQMREWPGFESAEGIGDHLVRCLPRDGGIFEAMQEGHQYPDALKVAEGQFKAKAKELGYRRNSKSWTALRNAMVPPYNPATFPNRWWKMIRNKPARTLMAHLGKDCYSHIHYEGAQRRTISIREAARLQSFPDGFKFAGTMNPSFRQIGNAVPPLMAWEIAKVMRLALKGAVARLSVGTETPSATVAKSALIGDGNS